MGKMSAYALAGFTALAALTAVPALAADKVYKVPRTSDGQPDLQGAWTNATLTPLERPIAMGERRVMTPDEVRTVEGNRAEIVRLGDAPTPAGTDVLNTPCYAANEGGEGPSRRHPGSDCGYNAGFTDHGDNVMRVNGEPRTSLITFPANGRVPAMVPGASTRRPVRAGVENSGFGSTETGPAGPADNPEQRTMADRCITSFGNHAGPVMLPSFYNSNYQIVQSKDSVAILVEMIHDVRIVRLNAKHGELRPYYGDSIGRFEGDTLVVETINYHPARPFRGSAENLKVTERFTRVGPTRMKYEFKVEDPTVWAAPWGGEYEFSPSKGPVFEYACHEGNYAMEGILAGARAEEAAARRSSTAAPR